MYVEFLCFQRCSTEEPVYFYFCEMVRDKFWLDPIATLTMLPD